MKLTPREIEIRRKLRDDFLYYAPRNLWIKSKSGKLIRFQPNRAQLYIHKKIEEQKKKTGRVRMIGLKGRQQGFSTFVDGRHFHKVTNSFGANAYIMAHNADTTQSLFEMTLNFYECSEPLLRPSCSKKNQNRLVFDKLKSGYRVGTAGSSEVGRGQTIQYLHCSEVAFWVKGDEIAKGLMQAVPEMDDTEIILESTAHGMNNYFYQQWMRAESGDSDFIPVFIPWYWQEEYRKPVDEDFYLTPEEKELKRLYGLDDEQIYWRKRKIASLSTDGSDGEWAFKQEYPNEPSEAFQTSIENAFILTSDIVAAKKYEAPADPNAPLIMGVDPGRDGDETAMMFRQGRKAFGLKTFKNMDEMKLAGIIASTLDKHPQIDFVYIDFGGGAGTYDRLREMGYFKKVRLVHFGAAARDDKRYMNKRAEMYGRTRKWLHQRDVQIPDDDMLHADLASQTYELISDTRIKLHEKKKIKKELGRSPDRGDALVLTFAEEFYDISKLI